MDASGVIARSNPERNEAESKGCDEATLAPDSASLTPCEARHNVALSCVWCSAGVPNERIGDCFAQTARNDTSVNGYEL
jgi:hypothetical protein